MLKFHVITYLNLDTISAWETLRCVISAENVFLLEFLITFPRYKSIIDGTPYGILDLPKVNAVPFLQKTFFSKISYQG